MNAPSNLAQALGWALVHFVWQGAAIACALAIVQAVARPVSARVRYGLACLALAAMPIAFAATMALSFPRAGTRDPAAHLRFATATAGSSGAIVQPEDSAAARLARRAAQWAPAWAAGVLCLYLFRLGGWMAAQRLRRTGTCMAAAHWRARLAELGRALGVSRAVLLLESPLAEVPVVIGWLRPAILFPAGMLAGLPPDQVEAVLAHELAHIRRADYAVNLLQTLVEGLLFYHPAVWWVSSVIRAERENCCDDAALAIHGDPRGYAAALLSLEESRPALAPAASGGNLMRRIERILRGTDTPRSNAAPAVLAVAALLAAGLLLAGAHKAPAAAQDGSPYDRWLNEDVVYIIEKAEHEAFQNLHTDAERAHFIEQFWLRRDPTPGTPENEFKEEHYRRIAFANAHFLEDIPGWKTDRGRIYVMYGPPDGIEKHDRSEQWHYRVIEGIGRDVIVEFTEDAASGRYRMTRDPNGR
jgi:GWxTD domain-containing protein